MSEVECLKQRLVEKDIFIQEILKEMKEIYDAVDGLKDQADSIGFEFLTMMKAFK